MRTGLMAAGLGGLHGWMAGVEAVIVAGGRGTRLRPLTQHQPKHLLPVGGVPFVVHLLAKLAAAGVEHVVLATGYRAASFEPVLGDGSRWGIRLAYVTEAEPLGTAGAIRNVVGELRSGPDQAVVILNGDILSGHDLGAQLRRHDELQADVTLHLVEVADARAFGCVPTDAQGRVVAFLEKTPDPVSRQVNAGCYVFRRKVIDAIPPDRVVSVERQTFPQLLAEGSRVFGFLQDCYWLDLGTPAALVRGSSDLVRGVATSPAYPHPPSESLVDEHAWVGAGSSLRGGSVVSSGARIGAHAVVDQSLVCAGAQVGEGARVTRSVVGPGARVGDGAELTDSVVGDRATVGARCQLAAGARVFCDLTIPDGAIRFSPDV